MIEMLDSPPHVIAMRFVGTLDLDDYERVIRTVEEKLAAHPKIGVYADMTGFTDMTGSALVRDVRYNLEKLGQWSRFPRAAMVTDKQWLRTLIQMLDPLFPQFEAKVFEPCEEAAALAWASEVRS